MGNTNSIGTIATDLNLKLKASKPNLKNCLRQRLSLYGCLAALWTGAGVWLGWQAIAPQVVFAATYRQEVTLSPEPEETYQTLIRRAEAAARVAAQQGFDNNSTVTDVVITVLGEEQEQIVPLLTLNVSRADWRSFPDPQRWATYYRAARTLLQLDPVVTTPPPIQPTPVQPTPTDPTATPTAAPTTPLPNNIPGSVPTPLPTGTPGQPSPATPTSAPGTPGSPVIINIPAAPAGQLGLPRSILR